MVDTIDCEVLRDEKSETVYGRKFMGVSFGASYRYEHEVFINTLRDLLGLEGDKATKFPKPQLIQAAMRDHPVVALVVSGKCDDQEGTQMLGNYPFFSGKGLYTATGDNGFCIMGTDDASIAIVREMYQAYLNHDFAVFFGNRPGFSNTQPRLVVTKASTLSQYANV